MSGEIEIDADEREALQDEREAWNRVTSSWSGRATGWKDACAAIRERAGALFAEGKDSEARTHRAVAEWLEKHPKPAEYRAEESSAYEHYQRIGERLGEED